MKEEIVDNDEIIDSVNEKKILFDGDRYIKDSIKDLKKDYPDEIEKLEETLHIYIEENDLKLIKTEFSDNRWIYLTKKLAYPYEYFNGIDDYQKLVDNLKKADFLSKIKKQMS